MPKRRCLNCSALTHNTRCPTCTRIHRAPKRQADNKRYDTQWRNESERIRQAWVAEHGWWCPGWRDHQPHPANDLVVDHDIGVCCRAVNSSKSQTWDKHNPHA